MTVDLGLNGNFNVFTGVYRVPIPGFPNTKSSLAVGGRLFELVECEKTKTLYTKISSDTDISGEWLHVIQDKDSSSGKIFNTIPIFETLDRSGDIGYVLSICIPTFNRAQRCVAAVKSALECASPKLQVVVRDNNSTDNTLEVLSEIKDKRLRVYSNDENIGPIRNFNYALASGDAEFVLLHSDEDLFLPDALDELISFLSTENSISCGLTSVLGSVQFKNTSVCKSGRDALEATARAFTYIGGFFFRRTSVNFASMFPKYSDPSYLYPFENICWDLCGKGDFLMFSPVTVRRGRNDKSYFPRIGKRHFNHPVCLIDQFLFRACEFKKSAAEFLTNHEIELATHRFAQAMLRQNFALSYETPLEEKLEILQRLWSDVGFVRNELIPTSLAAQASAELLMENKDWEAARYMAQRAVNVDPENTAARYVIADCMSQMGEVEMEAAMYQEIVRMTQRHWSYMQRTFIRLIKRERLEEAKMALELLMSSELNAPNHIIEDAKVMYKRAIASA